MGHQKVAKPSRSDEVLDADQQLKISNQIRAQFDSLAPKRPTKPSRSEPDSTTDNPSAPVSTIHQNIPEFDKLRSLQSQSYGMYPVEGACTVTDEFVETHYYKELISIDKQHHTTGSGFIRVMKEGAEENGFNLELGNGLSHGNGNGAAFKSNPAKNDWIPSV
ncbi:uncharacterized protein LOC123213042 [Mangifera indica]|uniref:uncharacterized protein LOC123213042 n=1 Tax=Mangifera indica TaxID=29780 RepID=UPI001CFB70E6|nr:uncharacterized protein LOC123213042 [Mangifera indica]